MSTILLLQPQLAMGARLQALIDAVPGFRVLGCVVAPQDLRQAVVSMDPDLVLADLETLGRSVSKTLRQLREGRCDRPRVLVIAMSADDPRLVDALRDGVDGWFAPGTSRSLPTCMSMVLRGESMLTPAMAREVQDHFNARTWEDTDFIADSQNPLRLSGTERILLQLVADKHDMAEVARMMQIDLRMIGVRLRTVLRKLQLDLAADALSLA